MSETVDLLVSRIKNNCTRFGDQFPTVGVGTAYQLAPNDHWLSGFWTGLLWLAYAASGDEALRESAGRLLASFERRLDEHIHITHDLGFLFTLSARAEWQLTQNPAARDLALRAARELSARYCPQGEYIQAWGEVGSPDEGGRMIIDTLLNLPLLFWASQQTGDLLLYDIARQHAETAARYLVREDGSTYHTFLFNQQTGLPIGPRTHQGYADDSLWARGQAWAIYGFAVAGQWCGAAEFLETARRAAERYLAELPPSGVPWWDLRLPDEAPHHTDTSAGAIAAAGMFRLAALLPGGHVFREQAIRQVQALVTGYLETLPDAEGLLRGGTYHAHKGWGLDSYFICGDYFFLEALLMMEECFVDFWGPAE